MPEFHKLVNRKLNPVELANERKDLIKKIQEERGRGLIVFASDNTKEKAPYLINQEDVTVFSDLIASLKGTDKVDIFIHSSGGYAEVAEMLVKMLRANFSDITYIVPRFAKSAATMMVCSGNQILMDYRSELGPIDPQILLQGRRFAADAFSEGFKKILKETEGNRLNPAYLPVLQNITPADIQAVENAKLLSFSLVEDWLKQYMFKDLPTEEKETRAKRISQWLGNHGTHLSHGRAITINEAIKEGLNVEDYSKYKKLSPLIWKLYCNIELAFSMTNIYKIYETEAVHLFKQIQILAERGLQIQPQKASAAEINNKCNKCSATKIFQLNFAKVPFKQTPYPKDDKYVCENCGNNIDLRALRLQVEGLMGKKAILD